MSKNLPPAKPVSGTLREDEIVTERLPGRRSALIKLGVGAIGTAALLLHGKRGYAADAGDSDQTSVADYKWRSNSDENRYGDSKPSTRNYSDSSDLADNDETASADDKSAPDSDERHVANAKDTD